MTASPSASGVLFKTPKICVYYLKIKRQPGEFSILTMHCPPLPCPGSLLT